MIVCTSKSRSILIAGNKKIYPGETVSFDTLSSQEKKALTYFAAKGLLEVTFPTEEEVPPVIESAPVEEAPVEEAPAEAPVVESEEVPEEAASGKKRRGRK